MQDSTQSPQFRYSILLIYLISALWICPQIIPSKPLFLAKLESISSNKGFNIIEFRGQMAVSINDKGEYFISRKPHEIKSETPSTYVVVGTYSRQAKKVMLNARLIDNVSGKIISSARATYEHGLVNDCMMFADCPPARTINIVKER